MMDSLKKHGDAPEMKLYDDPDEEHLVWEVRESGLGATAWVPGEHVTWEGWEDSAVPPDKVGPYLARAMRTLRQSTAMKERCTGISARAVFIRESHSIC